MVFALALVVIGVLIKRLLDALTEKKHITRDLKELVLRIYEVVAVFSLLLVGVLELSPGYLVPLVIIFAVIAVVVVIFVPLRTYMSYLNVKMYTGLRGTYYMLLLPSHDNPVYGKIVDVETYYTVLEDSVGRRLLIPNRLLSEAILTSSTPTLTYLIKISLENEVSLDLVKAIIKRLEEYTHPLIRREKTVLLSEIGRDYFEIKLSVHPMSTPLDWDNISTLSTSIYEALVKSSEEIKGLRSVKIELTGVL